MTDAAYATFMPPNADASEYNQLAFTIRQIMNEMATATPVKVISVTPGSDLRIGTVNVQPQVKQVDADMTGYSHGVIYNLPYIRMQGGANAVICDPVAGDIGLMVFAHNDISVLKSTLAESVPGSRRRYDWADGIYVGAMLPQTAPTSYVQVTQGAVTIVNPTVINLQAPTVAITGDLTVSGTIVAQDEITGAGVELSTHVHSDVTGGPDDTGPPT